MDDEDLPETIKDISSLNEIIEEKGVSSTKRKCQAQYEGEEDSNSDTNDVPGVSNIPSTYVKHGPSHFECTINDCGRVVKTLQSVLKHAETHQDKSTYKYACEENGCGKRFLKKYSLELHYRVHMNLRPFICAICGKGFRESGNLERHFRIHTGSKPYKCLFKNCDKSYSQTDSLRIHVRTHTGDRIFACTHPGCDKDFYSKSNLIAHSRIHQGIRPYVCETCGMAFTENSSLYKHRKIHLKKMELVATETKAETCLSKPPSQNISSIPSPSIDSPVEGNQFLFLQESSKESDSESILQSPSKTTIIFLTAADTNQGQSNMNDSLKNAVLLPSTIEPQMLERSPSPDELDKSNCNEDPASDLIIEFEDTDKEFSSDVDRSADLGLDRITHQPDASIKMGLDEFMNSIRPDIMTTEYFNGEISFI